MVFFLYSLFIHCPLSFAQTSPSSPYTQQEILAEIETFFESTSKGLASIVQKVFSELGEPNGYIKGTEGGAAFVFGLRYGHGRLYTKNNGSRTVYWSGPSFGYDFGGNLVKVFTLVYNLRDPEHIYQRFPGVDGSAYVIGGVSMNYQKSLDITLVPIRSGLGLRLGANVGYIQYARQKNINPF
jgi:hypothetical protein